MIRAGGSAADAAVAASAVLAVTTQHMCGMGGDLFALVHHTDGSPPTCLDASGRAGSGADRAAADLRSAGHATMPTDGDVRAVTVPGCVDGWLSLHRRHGRLPLVDVLGPALDYATDGFPASPLLAATVPIIASVDGADDYSTRPLRAGTRITRPGVARTLEAIIEGGRDAFYLGEFGDGLRRVGDGLFHREDLERIQAEWVDPLGGEVWGHQVWTVPPTSQGYLSLAAARIAEMCGLTPGSAPDPTSAEWVHALAEAARLAGHDRLDVLFDGADGPALVDDARLGPLAQRFDPDRRADVVTTARSGDTIYLCAVDGDGMGVSLIQSNARGWGVYLTVPEVGIFLHNRGQGFSLESGHPAELAPGRRPPHTLAPALVQRSDGSLRAVLGTMGGDSQPQVVLQMLARMLLHDQSPARAVVSTRWRLGSGGFATWADDGPEAIVVEEGAPAEWERGLTARGHRVESVPAWGSDHGHAHLIERRPDGMLAGAHDPRALTGGTATW